MRLRWGIYLAILAAQATSAATIDVSAETNAVVHTGDTLVFHLLTRSFGVQATGLGLPVYPDAVNFALISAPLGGSGGFDATLESADGAVSVAFGDDLTFRPGYFQGSGYAGEVSTLQGYLHLAPQLSEALFSTSSAIIALRNEGPDVTVGLPPYLLRQDLFASLSGGPLSVGAVPFSVDLESKVNRAGLANLEASADFSADSEVPEPQSGRLLLGGGVLLCGLSVVLKRFSADGRKRYARKINRLHPLIHSDTIYMADRNPPLEPPQIHNGVTKSTE
jgi:hypothetical protein